MPARLSRILSRATGEKAAEVEAERNHRNAPSRPPAYGARGASPPVVDQDDVIVPPDVASGFKSLTISKTGSVPSVEECTAHLKVLECFYRLRQTVGSTDGLFGIEDWMVRDHVPEHKQDLVPSLLAKLAEKRWAIYISRAVERFETWLVTVLPRATPPTYGQLATKGDTGKLLDPVAPLRITKDNLPPVDVLMVWHAYMLNPRAFLEDCLRHGRMQLWYTGMPWQAAVDAINSETCAYEAGDEASKAFSGSTGLPWDNLKGTQRTEVACPQCHRTVEVPYTTCIASAERQATIELERLPHYIDKILSSGHGFCDQGFGALCSSCSAFIDHEQLRASKFRKDVFLFLRKKIPMAGTVLGNEGIPWKFGKQEDKSCEFVCTFANEVIRAGAGWDIKEHAPKMSMSDVRAIVERRIRDPNTLRAVRGYPGLRLGRGEKMSIRRMFSRYWHNSSPFAIDLVGAVVRQGSFIEKMHNIDWLHSPALPHTMSRLITKYTRFVGIMRDKSHMAVPTLDVDLAWHNHQLSPYQYFNYTVQITHQFIDHDDKIPETALTDAFAWTSKLYQKQYGEPYSACTCWYCEAVRESHTSAASKLFNTNVHKANDQLHAAAAGGDRDPAKRVHISAHNAVRPTDSQKYTRLSARKAEELERCYIKACERASRKGRKPPGRDDYYYSDAYGHPVYLPAYAPYAGAVAFVPGYYAASPGCMAMGAGAYGNCCRGTCGGGVVVGGCAGGGGGCGGGGASCGGGGGGGGCGGGGGGGGGGCGGGGGGGC